MHNNVINMISAKYTTLTKSGKLLADYILQNRNSVQYLSITTLAEASGVSEASITRFCRSLGLEGYNDLKLSIAISESNGSENGYQPFSDGLGESEIEKAGITLCHENIKALEDTCILMDKKSIESAVELLQNARRVYCFGQGGSNVSALEAWALFATVSPKFIHISDSHFQAMQASLCGPEDVILFFSYSGATKDLKDLMKITAESGVKVILITRYQKSPTAGLADVVLLCGADESPLQSGSVAARISQLFIIDYLFHFFCKKDQSEILEAREATAQATALKLL